jgi:hypothetical protein
MECSAFYLCTFVQLNTSKISTLEMAPRSDRADGEPPELREIVLSNIPDQGLGYYDKNYKLVRLVGT